MWHYFSFTIDFISRNQMAFNENKKSQLAGIVTTKAAVITVRAITTTAMVTTTTTATTTSIPITTKLGKY